jgi:hypothetical protein
MERFELRQVCGDESHLELWRASEEITYLRSSSVVAVRMLAAEKRDGTGVLMLTTGQELPFKLSGGQSLGPLVRLLFSREGGR